MDITIRFSDGPLDVEINTADDENYTEVLDNLSEFLERYSPPPQRTTSDDAPQGETDREVVEDPDKITGVSDIPPAQLSRVVKLGQVEGDSIKEMPRIIGDNSVIGESDQEKLVQGSAVILTILDELHGIDTVKTSDLKQALADSGLNINNWKNIGQVPDEEILLNRRGRGNSATTEVRPPGKDKALELINLLLEEAN